MVESWTNGFEICRGNRKRDVTTMVTHSHASTPLGQSERAYYLSCFINLNEGSLETRVALGSIHRGAAVEQVLRIA